VTRATFFDELARRVEGIPGVRSVAFANQFPVRGGGSRCSDRQSPLLRHARHSARARQADVTRGSQRQLHVAVVSQTFVRKFLSSRDPIGQQFAPTGRGARQ
jgi:hypothetical protein